jgi:hypothetical protein
VDEDDYSMSRLTGVMTELKEEDWFCEVVNHPLFYKPFLNWATDYFFTLLG